MEGQQKQSTILLGRLPAASVPYLLTGLWTIIAIGYFLTIFANAPITDHYAFRQTQVATVARELARGGPILDYYLPLFGPPWSAPLEFPLYQLIVAGVANVTGLGIEPSGRLVGLFSGAFALLALSRLAQLFDQTRKAQVLAIVIVGASPIFFYWSQALMIEVFTLALSLWMAVAAAEFVKKGRVWPLAYGVPLAIGAAMAKATTFAIFAIAIFLMFAAVWAVRAYRDRSDLIAVAKRSGVWLAYGVVLFVPALLLAFWYIDYGDRIKAASPLTQFLTSENLKGWNYGNPEQLKKALSYTVLPFRTNGPPVFMQAMGLGWVVVLALAVIGLALNPKHLVLALVLVCGFLAGPMIFSNLYEVHYYYWIANIVFALGFVVVGLSAGLEFISRRLGNLWSILTGAVICAGYVASAVPLLHAFFLSATIRGSTSLQAVGEVVQSVTEPDDIIYIFGYDWDPAVQYYTERFSLMGRDPGAALAYGNRMKVEAAAVVFCGTEKNPEVAQQRLATAPLNQSNWSPVNPRSDFCQVYKRADAQSRALELPTGVKACDLYIKALYTGAKEQSNEQCSPALGEDFVELSTTHGRRLKATQIIPGETVALSAETLWHRSKFVEATESWENPGGVYILRSSVPYCIEVTTFAPDATTDSLFLLRPEDAEPVMLPLPVDPDRVRTTVFPQSISSEDGVSVFAVYAREPRAQLKSLRLVPCN